MPMLTVEERIPNGVLGIGKDQDGYADGENTADNQQESEYLDVLQEGLIALDRTAQECGFEFFN